MAKHTPNIQAAQQERIEALYADFDAAREAVRAKTERQAMLDETLAKIAAAFPPRKGPAEIFGRLLAAGQPVAYIVERGA